MKRFFSCFIVSILFGCMPAPILTPERVEGLYKPTDVFLQKVRGDGPQDYQFQRTKLAEVHPTKSEEVLLHNGFKLKQSFDLTPVDTIQKSQKLLSDEGSVALAHEPQASPPPPTVPAGSQAPYFNGQMTSNPSLWPENGQGAFLFTDFRAFQPLDVITIKVNETTLGSKKAETETESKFSLLAAVKNFFGIETSKWEANNANLDAESLINATTNSKFEGEGETKRQGKLLGTISAVIMEVLPNGLLRLEGTKIVSLNEEEEVMVISGLVRQRDISSENEVDSTRIANMRIDFYGRGLIADEQSPGWLTRIIKKTWPF